MFIICILKWAFYCKYHLHRTQHTLTKYLLLSWALQTLQLAKVLGACTNMYTYNYILHHLWAAAAQVVVAMVLHLFFQRNSNSGKKKQKECVSSFPFYVQCYSFWLSVKNVYRPILGQCTGCLFLLFMFASIKQGKKHSLQGLQRKQILLADKRSFCSDRS